MSHKTLFQSCDILSRLHVTVWSYIFKMSASKTSESNCSDSVSSCSGHTDVWSESGSKLEEDIFEEQSKNVIFALNLFDV